MMFGTYDSAIRRNVAAHFPELFDIFGESGWLVIKALIWQESSFDVTAESSRGAKGLMQFMPKTAHAVGLKDPFNPEQAIPAGIKYLAEQYRRLAEIPHETDRLKAALASYNGGRGYINAALAMGRIREKQPESYHRWKQLGCSRGAWQTWECISALLPEAEHAGKSPDYKQTRGYVTSILDKWERLLDA